MRIPRDRTLVGVRVIGCMALAAIIGTRGGPVHGQQTSSVRSAPENGVSDTESAAIRLDELRAAAGTYRITLDTQPPRALTFKPEPVLRWTNPLRQTHDGAVFLWLANGRPEVVGCFYRYRSEGVDYEDHEFQSVALTGLRASRDGTDAWFPPGAGVVLKRIPDAPAPAQSSIDRLRQMRALAREFKASFDVPGDQSELRLLSQPIYRYDTHRADLVDGGLFAFVQTTDPEVLLLIEARADRGKPEWSYGIARMSMVNLKVDHRDGNVWKADWQQDRQTPSKPYVTLSKVIGAASSTENR